MPPQSKEDPPHIVVAMTGASGAILCIRLLEALKDARLTTHLVVSKWGLQTLKHETAMSVDDIRKRASHYYLEGDMAAPISSGSFPTIGMVVVPCSAKTLGAIASGYGGNLIHRAADVTLKERRKLVLAIREAPLSDIHLENMLRLSRAGAVIFPPVPAFYALPKNLDEMADQIASRILDQFGSYHVPVGRWTGMNATTEPSEP